MCIKKGDLAGYDAAMATGEDEFVKRRIYLTLERGRDIALRNLLRKVYIAGGFEESIDSAPPRRRTRISVAEFGAAICLGSRVQIGRLENDEVECLLANMIYKVIFPIILMQIAEIYLWFLACFYEAFMSRLRHS